LHRVGLGGNTDARQAKQYGRSVVLSGAELVGVGVAAFGAGIVNAVAGGGSLLSFPALLAVGVPAVAASATNTIALCPGYLGGVLAQRADLAGQRHRFTRLGVAAAIGGVTGAALLLATGDAAFRKLVPFLLLFACAVLGFQNQIKAHFIKPGAEDDQVRPAAIAAVGVAAVYGGYFGAGLGILLLAVLGVTLTDRLARLNALKQWISLVVNTTAAIFFVFKAPVAWSAVAVMAPASLIGGSVGGRLAGRLSPKKLRALVLAIGVAVAIVELVKRFR
jgi:uncharacterized protein